MINENYMNHDTFVLFLYCLLSFNRKYDPLAIVKGYETIKICFATVRLKKYAYVSRFIMAYCRVVHADIIHMHKGYFIDNVAI